MTCFGDATSIVSVFHKNYDPELGRFIQPDNIVPDFVNPQSYNRYTYVLNNPLRYTDPDGHVVETVWDVANVGMGLASLWSNIKEGKVGAAIVDGVGVVADSLAAATPFVPGGVGATIKAVRLGDKAVDAAKAAKNLDKAKDAAKTADTVADGGK